MYTEKLIKSFKKKERIRYLHYYYETSSIRLFLFFKFFFKSLSTEIPFESNFCFVIYTHISSNNSKLTPDL